MRAAIGTISGATLLVAISSCTAPAPADGPDAVAAAPTQSTATNTAAPRSHVDMPTVSAISPSATLNAPSTVPPPPGRPDTSPATYGDPVTASQAWMSQWCATDYRERRNGNIHRAAVFQTRAGKAADLKHGTTEHAYRELVARKLGTRCDHISAEISRGAPQARGRVYVVVTASRTQIAAERPYQVEQVYSTRALVQRADGRWLVDIPVDAG